MNPSNPIKQPDAQTEGASASIVEQNITKLRDIFPEAFTESSAEGKPRFRVNFDTLKQLLGAEVEEEPERYSFTWNGKARARRIAQTPSTGTLRPCPAESLNWGSTGNLFIEGDNLEVLKLLQKSFHRRVKMIYIDPPYNTGNEFIYPDRFQDNLTTYLQYTGQVTSEGLKLSANTESSGRYHTNWLNMMLPRLRLARNLLTEDGVAFISIDDHEFSNLKQLCDEVFGPENYLGEIIWQTATDNNATQIAIEHEYVLCYCRSKSTQEDWTRPSDKASLIIAQYDELKKRHGTDLEAIAEGLKDWINRAKAAREPDISGVAHYSYVDDKGVFYPGNSANTKPGGYNFDIIHPVTKKVCAKPANGYRWPEETFLAADAAGDVYWGEDHTTVPKVKKRIETANAMLKSVYYEDNRASTKRLAELMGGKVFDNPKSVNLIYLLASFVTEAGDIVLDFFAGSCSTAQALWGLDVSQFDGAGRRFILVQLPERIADDDVLQAAARKLCDKLGVPRTISEIGKERMRRVVKRIKDQGDQLPFSASSLDLGFRVLKLDSSCIKPWDADFDTLEQAVYDATENIKADRSEQDVLYELLLKFGLDLCVPIEERKVAGKTVFSVGAGALMVCLDKKITLDVVEGIAKLKEELKPEVMRVVFRDSGFKDDVVKTNAVQILKQVGLSDEHIRSI